MKKLLATTTSVALLGITASQVFAQDVLDAGVKQASGTVNASTPVGAIITFIVAFIIVIAVLLALMFIVLGAIQWITSGGDKAKVDTARNHIVSAVIGLIVIAFSFVLINVVIQALGLGDLAHLRIPRLTDISGLKNP